MSGDGTGDGERKFLNFEKIHRGEKPHALTREEALARQSLGELDPKEARRQLLLQSVRDENIQAQLRKRYREGPYVAREAKYRLSGSADNREEAGKIAQNIQDLRAVEAAALLQDMSQGEKGIDADPPFSLALAETYFRAIETLVKDSLMRPEAKYPEQLALREKYRGCESISALEIEFMHEFDSPAENRDRFVAIASVLKERDEKGPR